MIHRFEYNKFNCNIGKLVLKFLLKILAILYSLEICIILVFVYDIYYKIFSVSFRGFLFELFILLILQSIIFIIIIKKMMRSFFYSNISDSTFGFLGILKAYTECFIKLDDDNNEFFTVFNENIENRVYYNEIKKIYSFKKFIVVKYNEKAKLILPNIDLLKEKIEEKI